ncbi:hypothetical protein DPMN_178214 [Dreissena polymorpha]|uniref:Uncharacterized protein n=1 Tax=Dreissena polymorpha TaxID=45954 RepID=A0A9D4IIG9_DREPO|nr:hypothetical protein DPMN_178214 [Dreissena polymorpha]
MLLETTGFSCKLDSHDYSLEEQHQKHFPWNGTSCGFEWGDQKRDVITLDPIAGMFSPANVFSPAMLCGPCGQNHGLLQKIV